MADVLLIDSPDGAEIEFKNGVLTMTLDGLQNAARLSLFGGNEDDPGQEGDTSKQWALNCDEPVAERKLRSRTQYLLNTLPLTSSNLLRVKDAVEADLAWFVASKVASSVTATITIPALNRINIAIDIVVVDTTFSFVLSEAWRARAQT
jgi:phage gp46-like protein